MNRKTFIKLLAFLAGLYFVLEFLLPEKIGGAFDTYEVTAPAVLPRADGGYDVWYVGYYQASKSALGKVEVSPDGQAQPLKRPALRRSVFHTYDQLGFGALSFYQQNGRNAMLYLGRNPEKDLVLCSATETESGEWQRHGPVTLDLQEPAEGEDETFSSAVFTGAFAVTDVGGQPVLAVAMRDLVGAVGIHLATRESEGEWRVDPRPLELPRFDPAPPGTEKSVWRVILEWLGVGEVDATRSTGDLCVVAEADEAITLWIRWDEVYRAYRVSPGETGGLVGPEAAPRVEALGRTDLGEQVERLAVARTEGGYRAWLGMRSAREGTPPPEQSSDQTWIATAESGNGVTWEVTPGELAGTAPVVEPGRPAQPTYVTRVSTNAGRIMEIIGAFALGVAVVNLLSLHGRKVIGLKGGLHNSAIFLLAFGVMFACVFYGKPEDASDAWRGAFNFMFDNLQRSMSTAVFSIITFYMISAAYRAFRIRSLESAVMMVAAIIVMLGNVPLGNLLTAWAPGWLQLPTISDKLLNVVNSAAYRGIHFGILIGMIAMALRTWLGLEESLYRGVEGK